jgi:hypothetical protein
MGAVGIDHMGNIVFSQTSVHEAPSGFVVSKNHRAPRAVEIPSLIRPDFFVQE